WVGNLTYGWGSLHGIPHRRYLYGKSCSPDGRRAEGRQDNRLRPAAQSVQSRLEVPQARQGEGQEFLVGTVDQRPPADRSQDPGEPAPVLRRSPRQGLRLGSTSQAGDASPDGRRATGGAARDGAGNPRPDLRGGGNAETGSRQEADLRPAL